MRGGVWTGTVGALCPSSAEPSAGGALTGTCPPGGAVVAGAGGGTETVLVVLPDAGAPPALAGAVPAAVPVVLPDRVPLPGAAAPDREPAGLGTVAMVVLVAPTGAVV